MPGEVVGKQATDSKLSPRRKDVELRGSLPEGHRGGRSQDLAQEGVGLLQERRRAAVYPERQLQGLPEGSDFEDRIFPYQLLRSSVPAPVNQTAFEEL